MSKDGKILNITGLLAWVHKIVMLIANIFRKFWYILLVVLALVAVLIIIPMCYGAKFNEVVSWYESKLSSSGFVEFKDKVTAKIIDETRDKTESKHTIDEKPAEKKLASWNVAAFNKARYQPKKKEKLQENEETFADLKREAQKQKEVEIEKNAEENTLIESDNQDTVLVVEEQSKENFAGDIEDYYLVLDNLNLEYLTTSEIIKGNTKVVGPNNLYVNDKFVFLYGIYTNPRTYDAEAAQNYLKSLVSDNEVYCEIVAYAIQTQAATALCFVDGMPINKAMVENGYADNVALK